MIRKNIESYFPGASSVCSCIFNIFQLCSINPGSFLGWIMLNNHIKSAWKSTFAHVAPRECPASHMSCKCRWPWRRDGRGNTMWAPPHFRAKLLNKTPIWFDIYVNYVYIYIYIHIYIYIKYLYRKLYIWYYLMRFRSQLRNWAYHYS